MKPILVCNDLHLGVSRIAGTTPASAEALKAYLLNSFSTLLSQHQDNDLLIAGDLFDNFEVDSKTLLDTYYILADWLNDTGNALHLMGGNHDFSPRGDKVSSFHLLANFLQSRFGDKVQVIDQGLQQVREGIWAISHVANQDVFELELAKALELDGGTLILHCNVMPPACHGQRDHSLALNEAQCRSLTEKFTILGAHEHQHLIHTFDRPIIMMGNQWPSSVSDCMVKGVAQKDGKKYAHVISEAGIDRVETWGMLGEFGVTDWRDLDAVCGYSFIRVGGTAKAEEAALVMSAIAKFRASSSAFVVSNAVVIEGVVGAEEAAEAIYSNVKAFNVMEALLEHLTDEQQIVVREVLSA